MVSLVAAEDTVRLEIEMDDDGYEMHKGTVKIEGEVTNTHEDRDVSGIIVTISSEHENVTFAPTERTLNIKSGQSKGFEFTASLTGDLWEKTKVTIEADGDDGEFYDLKGDSATVYLLPLEGEIKIRDPAKEVRIVVDEMGSSTSASFDVNIENTGLLDLEGVSISLSYDEDSLSCSSSDSKKDINKGRSERYRVSCSNVTDGKRVTVRASDAYGVATDIESLTFRIVDKSEDIIDSIIVGNVTGISLNDSAGNALLTNYADSWPLFRGGLERTGYRNLTGDMGEDYLISWTYNTPRGIFGSPAVADLDGDGDMEIVVPLEKTAGVAADTILVLDLTGNLVWSFKTDLGVFSSPALEDLNGDGMLEIIFGTNSAEVYVLDSEGNEIWKFDKLVGVFKSSPLAFDLDGDDVKEVYIGSDDGLYCINGDNGEMEWKYPTALEVSSSPAIGNIDGDDELELVFSSEDGVVYAVDWNGALVWALELDSGVVFSTPAIIDGKVILGTEEGKLIIIRDGKILNSYSTSSSIRGSVAVTEDYIVFGTYEEEILQQGSAKDSGNRIYALGSSGNLLWEFKTGGWGVFASPAIADIDRDEELEVVVGSREGRLYSIDLETGSEEWNYFDGSGILASPALVDIDRDGDLEIIVAYRLSNQIKLLDSPEKANLRISNILFSNDLAANNEIITATVIVENVGELAAEDFVVSVYKDFGESNSFI
jgi:outer membrane protein assembly factor BamB